MQESKADIGRARLGAHLKLGLRRPSRAKSRPDSPRPQSAVAPVARQEHGSSVDAERAKRVSDRLLELVEPQVARLSEKHLQDRLDRHEGWARADRQDVVLRDQSTPCQRATHTVQVAQDNRIDGRIAVKDH